MLGCPSTPTAASRASVSSGRWRDARRAERTLARRGGARAGALLRLDALGGGDGRAPAVQRGGRVLSRRGRDLVVARGCGLARGGFKSFAHRRPVTGIWG